MRATFETLEERVRLVPARVLVAAVLLAVSVGMLGAASSAHAMSALKEEFLPFADCPVETAADCFIAETTSGEFVIDRKTVPIDQTITLQGGLPTSAYTPQSVIGAADGNTLSKTPLSVPGGLLGIKGLEALGGEVTATAEIAGPPSAVIVSRQALVLRAGAAVTLPIKVKLSNEVLGEECYVGSDAEPIVLHLTDGRTSPPAPTQPIQGSASLLEGRAKGKITRIAKVSLVDNDFAVPAASGCGGSLSAALDLVVDADIGLPSPAGSNTAIMNGSLEETAAAYAAKYKPKPKKVKK
jgi:hypothetical protein